jgi:hypothetical protein
MARRTQASTGGDNMKADFILIRPKDGSRSEAEVQSFQIANITHVPRVGDRI